jgi:hypothetical protein
MLVAGVFAASTDSIAGKPGKCSPWPACKDDGGDPPPPPAECTDPFPGFTYVKPGGRNSADLTYLALANGCDHIPLPGVGNGSSTGQQFSTVHMTDVLPNGSVNGVFIWSEEPDGNQLRRADFTVTSTGDLDLDLTTYPDALNLGDPGVPDGDLLRYVWPDVWGSSTHDELYLVVVRVRSGLIGGGSHSLWIYNLNDLSDKRELYVSVDNSDGWISNSWPCPADINHPEAVAGCYRPGNVKWNPTGAAIYIWSGLRPQDAPAITSDWAAGLRLQITRGVPLSNWSISAPQMVYLGSATETADEPGGIAAMPGRGATGVGDLISQTGDPRGILDVETCVTLFTPPIPDPDLGFDADLWVTCLVDIDPYSNISLDVGDTAGHSWLSSNEFFYNVREKRQLVSIYKTNIHTGESTKLIDDAENPDSGN